MLTIEELIAGVRDLVPLPKAYLRIQELVNDPDSSLDEVTQVITNDAALTSRILRIANSAYMGLAAKVETVGRAVQVLGLNQVHDLALAGAAVGSLTKIETPGLDISDFWRRSVYCAVTARIICKQRQFKSPERLFVAGLLHDTGHLLLAYRDPARFAEIRLAAIESAWPMENVELETLGFTYAELGAALLDSWQLPDGIVNPVRNHVAKISSAPPEQIPEASIMHISAVLARASMWRTEADEPVPEFQAAALELNSIGDTEIDAIMHEADGSIIEAMSLLVPEAAKGARSQAA